MRLQTGWYSAEEFFIVKPLHNKCRQSLVMEASYYGFGRWNISMGIFSSNVTYHSLKLSPAWQTPTSTNKNPSMNVLFIALEALNEIEQEIHAFANGKKALIYIDGLDARRLRTYIKILTKKYGYKKSSVKSDFVYGMPLIYKKV